MEWNPFDKGLALIDADLLAYKITAAEDKPIHWGNDVWTRASDMSVIRGNIDMTVEGYKERLCCDRVILCISEPDRAQNFRRDILPEYKQHRGKTAKPTAYNPAIEYIREKYPVAEWPRLEADDVMGILMTDPRVRGPKVMVSIDKDMRTVPGFLYNPDHPDRGVTFNTKAEADNFHLTQALCGDTADGYAGCPGIGKVRAAKLLSDLKGRRAWEAVRRAFEDQGLSEAAALVQARVARILRHRDFRRKRGGIRLWTPNASNLGPAPWLYPST